jgi:hypothetical protein
MTFPDREGKVSGARSWQQSFPNGKGALDF